MTDAAGNHDSRRPNRTRCPPGMVLAPAEPRYVMRFRAGFRLRHPPENLPRIFEPFFTTKAMSAAAAPGLGFRWFMNWPKKWSRHRRGIRRWTRAARFTPRCPHAIPSEIVVSGDIFET